MKRSKSEQLVSPTLTAERPTSRRGAHLRKLLLRPLSGASLKALFREPNDKSVETYTGAAK